jgi:hypothetical protein
MITPKIRLLLCACLMTLSCGVTLLVAGCGSGNQNEAEFLSSAPPGKPSEFPNETVAQRKERTRSKSKKELAPDVKTKGTASKTQ